MRERGGKGGHAKDDNISQRHTTIFNKTCLLVQKKGKGGNYNLEAVVVSISSIELCVFFISYTANSDKHRSKSTISKPCQDRTSNQTNKYYFEKLMNTTFKK